MVNRFRYYLLLFSTVTSVHFVLSCTLLYIVGFGFDHPSTWIQDLAIVMRLVLDIPLLLVLMNQKIAIMVDSWFGVWAWLLFVMNSALWGAAACSAHKLVSARKAVSPVKV